MPREPLVLVVDDHPDNVDMYVEILVSAGYRTEYARDGAEALERATANVPHLVLMDAAMPGMDGIEATRRLKADPRTAHVPVIGLTGQGDDATRALRAAGCSDVCRKPVLPMVVLATIARVLERSP